MRAGVVVEREARRADAPRRAEAARLAAEDAHYEEWSKPREERRHPLYNLIRHVACREIGGHESFSDVLAAFEQRLDDDEAYMNFHEVPLFETVKQLCEDLQLSPDWSRWTGEGWEPEDDPFWRPLWSPYRNPSREPVGSERGANTSGASP